VRKLGEGKKGIRFRDVDYSDRLFFNELRIKDDVVERANRKAPNTVKLGTVGLIGGAFLGGPVGALAGAVIGSLSGFLLDEKPNSSAK
jgi:ABC-type dipeptide/oligopeptide/nickel transport system permease component